MGAIAMNGCDDICLVDEGSSTGELINEMVRCWLSDFLMLGMLVVIPNNPPVR